MEINTIDLLCFFVVLVVNSRVSNFNSDFSESLSKKSWSETWKGMGCLEVEKFAHKSKPRMFTKNKSKMFLSRSKKASR